MGAVQYGPAMISDDEGNAVVTANLFCDDLGSAESERDRILAEGYQLQQT